MKICTSQKKKGAHTQRSGSQQGCERRRRRESLREKRSVTFKERRKKVERPGASPRSLSVCICGPCARGRLELHAKGLDSVLLRCGGHEGNSTIKDGYEGSTLFGPDAWEFPGVWHVRLDSFFATPQCKGARDGSPEEEKGNRRGRSPSVRRGSASVPPFSFRICSVR